MQQNFTRWESSYSVGNWMLDNQHKVILSLFKEAIQNVPGRGRVASGRFQDIRKELVYSVEDHFDTEEGWLNRSGYTLLADHKKEHSASQQGLAKFLGAAASGKIDEADFTHYLSRWWFEHILDSDKKFAVSLIRIR